MTDEDKTSLDRSPPGEPFLKGMELGSSIDAITGEMLQSAIDPSTIQVKTSFPSDTGESFSFASVEDVRSFKDSNIFKSSATVTIPLEGLNVNDSTGIDFSDTSSPEGSSALYVVNWERISELNTIAGGAKLLPAAATKLAEDVTAFRTIYGDYFIHEISTKAKFTAVWKCTAESQGTLKAFKANLNISANSPGDINGTANFEAALSNAALSTGNVTITVKYDTIGNAHNTHFNANNVTDTFDSFQKNCVAVPDAVYLRHYSFLDDRVPITIPMDPALFLRMGRIFSETRFVLYLIGIAPGSPTTRLIRRMKVNDIYRTLQAKKLQYYKGAESLTAALDELDGLRDLLISLLDRQDLITRVRSMSVKDIKNLFRIDQEDVKGSWVRSFENQVDFSFGRCHSTVDSQKYATVEVLSDRVQMGWELLQCRESTLSFPGTSGVAGTVVGLRIRANWNNGTDGFWAIPQENPLGKKAFKIDVRSLSSYGMDWTLFVVYIPDEHYDA